MLLNRSQTFVENLNICRKPQTFVEIMLYMNLKNVKVFLKQRETEVKTSTPVTKNVGTTEKHVFSDSVYQGNKAAKCTKEYREIVLNKNKLACCMGKVRLWCRCLYF